MSGSKAGVEILHVFVCSLVFSYTLLVKSSLHLLKNRCDQLSRHDVNNYIDFISALPEGANTTVIYYFYISCKCCL